MIEYTSFLLVLGSVDYLLYPWVMIASMSLAYIPSESCTITAEGEMSWYNPCLRVWLVCARGASDLVIVWHATDTQHRVYLSSLLPAASRYYPLITTAQPERG